jgi:signal transduction histidine kinase
MFTQRQLIRRYFLISFLLLAGGLTASGLVELYFRYHEIREDIGELQQEAATGAAAKVGQFMHGIHTAMTAATRSREIGSAGPGFRDGPLRKLFDEALASELERLLLVAPAVTEAMALDADGAARARASRLRHVHPEGKRDFSESVGFQQSLGGQVHFGPAHFVRDAEPHVTVSVPIEILAGVTIGVLQAEVSLIYLGEQVVSRLETGETGYAYIVSRSGHLIAHPQVKLVLQQRDLSGLEQVRQALASEPAEAGTRGALGRNMQGEQVFSSYAPVPGLDWIVFVERPAGEVYRPLFASIRRTVGLLLVGLGMALVASVLVARRILRPLETLRQGVTRIGQGDLAFRLKVETGDEIETLADEFNRMSARLQEAYTGLEQKVAERTRELVALNQQLDQANRLKSQFLANVSHEFRTPMNAIIGFTRLVMRKTETQIPPLQHANLQKVLISAEHLLTLINGLLDLSKIEAGRMEVSPVKFDLAELVHAATTTIEPMLRADRVALVTDVAADLPPLFTDREKLRQILMNLLSNAAKFTDEGFITVSASRAGDGIRLSVADTGIGMPPDALEYIFEEFRQVDMSSTRRHGGTGLGLAIVRRLVRLLGGQVHAESELGKGSAFTLTLPLILPKILEPAAPTATVRA